MQFPVGELQLFWKVSNVTKDKKELSRDTY